jgi:hypothetical protein
MRQEPTLSFHRVGRSWLAGVKELSDRLDALGAPLDITNRKAQALLQANGGGARSALLAQTLTYRREMGLLREDDQ